MIFGKKQKIVSKTYYPESVPRNLSIEAKIERKKMQIESFKNRADAAANMSSYEGNYLIMIKDAIAELQHEVNDLEKSRSETK